MSRDFLNGFGLGFDNVNPCITPLLEWVLLGEIKKTGVTFNCGPFGLGSDIEAIIWRRNWIQFEFQTLLTPEFYDKFGEYSSYQDLRVFL